MDLDQIAALEGAAYRAVPAAEVDELGGWRLRATPGLSTRRPNSVLASGPVCSDELGATLAEVERFYAERRLPARFQLSPASRPHGLEQLLRERGYRTGDPTAVQTASLEGLHTAAGTVEITPSTTGIWWRAWSSALGADPARQALLAALFARVVPETAFAVVSLDGVAAGVGMGVRDGAWLGIFNMATRPACRCRGVAQAALSALMAWGRDRGAVMAYLQVAQDNAPALELYRRVGFTPRYVYRYLER